jgi:two-component system, chemotaxis family, sensor kinase CheA
VTPAGAISWLLVGVLGALAAYLQFARSRLKRAALEAQEQTREILKTVQEGVFLLDAEHRITGVWSNALSRMFGRTDFAGLSFEDLLKDLVTADTLATAQKYLKLLWGERAQHLINDINPLSQLEISPDEARGGRESRFLQFAFNRVMGPQGVKHILCSVTDTTATVMLGRETREEQESPQEANAHVEMTIDLMQVDPLQLGAFLTTADTGLEIVNTMLRKPARSDAEFREKLEGLTRQFQSLKREASALNIKSIAARLQHLEDLVAECRKAPQLSGVDFLPMVLKLDELLAHLTVVSDVAGRLAVVKKETTAATAIADAAVFARRPQPDAPRKTPRAKHSAPAPVSAPAPASASPRAEPASARSAEAFLTLPAIAEILAKEHEKRLALTLAGLDKVPSAYLAMIKACLIQMLRNAAMHGIESPIVRRAENKDEIGAIKVTFATAADGYQLVFEDDGVGIRSESLKQAALRQQLIGLDEAAAMDSRAAIAMIFRPGFSTWKKPSQDIGRGLGMDEVARAVHSLGGRIGVSTRPGKYTRFTITLPAVAAARSAVA